jgi:hypothetical protein
MFDRACPSSIISRSIVRLHSIPSSQCSKFAWSDASFGNFAPTEKSNDRHTQ